MSMTASRLNAGPKRKYTNGIRNKIYAPHNYLFRGPLGPVFSRSYGGAGNQAYPCLN
jgi:hypothetical protein